MVYKIRKIHDDTKIKQECCVVVAVWLIFSVWQYCLFAIQEIAACDNTTIFDTHISLQVSYQLTYWSIIARDVVTAIITLCY